MAAQSLKVIVVTSSYPYGTDEEFPAQEAARWPVGDYDFTLVPLSIPGELNRIPAGIALDTRLARYRTRQRKFVATAVACVHVLLLREILEMIRNRALNPARLIACVRVVGQTLLIRRGLRRVLAGLGSSVVVYTYWHSSATYAAVLLKRGGRVATVVSRAHAFDLYEDFAPARWHPLKRQLINDIDHTWTVSSDGARELVERYGGDPRRVSVSRLGVVVPEAVGPLPDHGPFQVLSMSTCTPKKQVPLIARAVARFADAHPDVDVRWSHLGSGPGLEELRAMAEDCQERSPNLSICLPGFVEHAGVEQLLGDRAIDVMVSASTSEGVPVSIMEAMSYGVPVIASDVGGVRELVGVETGWLLSSVVTESELTAALNAALIERGSPERRYAARQRVEERFDSTANYSQFRDDLVRRLQQRPD